LFLSFLYQFYRFTILVILNNNIIMISIITPTYNSAKYLRETILSVENQINPADFEHIIVDGGSTDETKEISEKQGISKFYVLEGSSMYEAIDFGFKQSKGDILCWLNSDDLFMNDTINYVSNFFTLNKDVNIIAGNTIYIDDCGNEMYKYRFPKITNKMFKSFNTLYLCQPSVFWRRNVYFDKGGLNLSYKLSADRDFIFRATENDRLVYVDKVLSMFRIHEHNLSKTNADLAKREDAFINERLSAGHISLKNKIFSLFGHIYIKLNNPQMILWKSKKFFKL
jgi:glycosyltransferase involved in cell wall biosynthesis